MWGEFVYKVLVSILYKKNVLDDDSTTKLDITERIKSNCLCAEQSKQVKKREKNTNSY